MLFQQSQSCEGRVTLVHVKHADIVVAKRAQHRDAAQSQYYFLAQAIAFIAAVEKIRETAIGGGILRQIRVEKTTAAPCGR